MLNRAQNCVDTQLQQNCKFDFDKLVTRSLTARTNIYLCKSPPLCATVLSFIRYPNINLYIIISILCNGCVRRFGGIVWLATYELVNTRTQNIHTHMSTCMIVCVCLLVELSRTVRNVAVCSTLAHTTHHLPHKPLVIRTCYYSKIEMVILLFPFEIRLHALQRTLVTGSRTHTHTHALDRCIRIQLVYVRAMFSYQIHLPGFGGVVENVHG